MLTSMSLGNQWSSNQSPDFPRRRVYSICFPQWTVMDVTVMQWISHCHKYMQNHHLISIEERKLNSRFKGRYRHLDCTEWSNWVRKDSQHIAWIEAFVRETHNWLLFSTINRIKAQLWENLMVDNTIFSLVSEKKLCVNTAKYLLVWGYRLNGLWTKDALSRRWNPLKEYYLGSKDIEFRA
jgi:hypothetical protein